MTGGINFTGRKLGTVLIAKLANSDPRMWEARCEKCGSVWTLPDRVVRNHFMSGGGAGALIPCRLAECRLGRMQPAKITEHERWLNSPDEVKAETPAVAPAKPVPELSAVEIAAGRARGGFKKWQ